MPREKDTADTVVVGFVGGLIAAGITGGIAALWPSLKNAAGEPLATLICGVVIVCGIALFVSYKRYFDLLGCGDEPLGSYERTQYEKLRANLANGGMPAKLYSDRLVRFLNGVDRFFGDRAEQTLLPHAFGLKAAAPLWTAPALDRCLLLALAYPIVSIYVMWAASGHVGPAEHALKLAAGLPLWRRALGISMDIVALLALRKGMSLRGWKSVLWLGAALISVVAPVTFAASSIGAATVAVVCMVAFAAAADFTNITPGTGVVGVTLAIPCTVGGMVVGSHVAVGLGISVSAMFFCFILIALSQYRLSLSLMAFFAVMFALSFGAARFLSIQTDWPLLGPVVLFLGLLTLLNAPFDWISLGLTRALLRRGIELGGWWAYALALVDAILATIVVAALAIAMILGVNFFAAMERLGHSKPTLMVAALLNGIEKAPSAPEFWWVYALLLSTMLPSLANLVIGGACFVRGVPGFPAFLLRYIPEQRSVSRLNRNGVALALSGQWLVGGLLGVAAQFVLVWFILGNAMPMAGVGLLDLARWIDAHS